MADEFDWPVEPVTVALATVSDDSWLDIDTIEAPKSALPYDSLRFQCMRGSGRVWACDGRYVAYRPFNREFDKEVNPAFQERVERFTRAGHFKHLGTFDEVRIFQLEPKSPWYAKTDQAYTAGQSLWGDINHAVKLACARDWVDYVDLIEAMATGMMAGRDPMFARQQWEAALNQIMIGVYQRGGQLPGEIRAGIQNVQIKRGKSGAPKILMATDVAQAKNVVFER